MEPMHVGERIKLRRLELNMTQEELAKKVGYKSRTSINKIELARSLPLSKVEKMAKALDVTPSYLMGWTSIPSDVLKDSEGISHIERYMHSLTSMYHEKELYENLLKAAHGNSPENIQLATDMLMRLKGTTKSN